MARRSKTRDADGFKKHPKAPTHPGRKATPAQLQSYLRRHGEWEDKCKGINKENQELRTMRTKADSAQKKSISGFGKK